MQVVLTSNPGNPTGALVEGEELADLVKVAREQHCTFIMDEFYSHYIYSHGEDQMGSFPLFSILYFYGLLMID